MAGRRLVDAAKLFQASKSIAAKHINLRSQQLDVYTKTSSLAKAVKNQTDRVTLTAQAAIALAKRVNEEPPSYASGAASQAASYSHEKPAKTGAAEPPAKGELNIQQKEAEREPLPDGTILPGGVPLERDGTVTDTKPGGSVDETIREGRTQKSESGTQVEEGDGIQPVASAASTIPTPAKSTPLSADEARNLQRKYEAQIPSSDETIQSPARDGQAEGLSEGHDKDVFYLRSKESQPEPSSLPRTKIPKHTEDTQESVQEVKDGRLNQDVFYKTPAPGQTQPTGEEVPQKVAVPEQDQLPQGINTDVFRTKRVAEMLNPYTQKPKLDLHGAAKTPLDHTKLAEGRDQDTINARTSDQTTPSRPTESAPSTQKVTEEEMHDFASELAMDAQAPPSPVSEVRDLISISAVRYADRLTAGLRYPVKYLWNLIRRPMN